MFNQNYNVNIIFDRINLPVSHETHNDSVGKDLEGGIAPSDKAKVGSAGFLIELENRRSIKVCEIFLLLIIGLLEEGEGGGGNLSHLQHVFE